MVAAIINVSIYGGPSDVALIVGVFVSVQWVLIQIPLWLLVFGLNLQLEYQDDVDKPSQPVHRRFNLVHLFILMAIAGVLLGLGRVILPMINLNQYQDVPTFLFLGVANTMLALPLLLSCLIQRNMLLCVTASLGFFAAGTFVELTLLSLLTSHGPPLLLFIAINAVSAIVTLAITSTVRFSGYRLHRKSVPK